MTKLRTHLLRTFAILAIVAAVAIVAQVAGSPARAQQQSAAEFRVQELERRVGAIDAEKLVERVARVEVLCQSNNTLLFAAIGALGLLLIDRAVRIGASGKKETHR